MDSEQQIRKSPRLQRFDYSSSGYYFITICTSEHRCLFCSVVVKNDIGEMLLNCNGEIVDRHIMQLNTRYPTVTIDKYTVMPNHIHMIVALDNYNSISLSRLIGLFKSGVSKEIGYPVWQRSFHDHIIRDETDYRNIWNYIDSNPAKWVLDRYYINL